MIQWFMLVTTCQDHAGPGYMPWLRSLRPKKVALLVRDHSQFRLVPEVWCQASALRTRQQAAPLQLATGLRPAWLRRV